MLDIADVLPYLLERGLVSARAVVDGSLQIIDRSQRNRVFVVVAVGERGLVVKQAADDPAGVCHEAMVLDRLRAADRRLAARLPTLVVYDAGDGILVLEGAQDPQTLRERHACGRYSRELAAHMGRTLALLHATPAATLGGHASPWDTRSVLRMHRPSIRDSDRLTDAAIELVGAIQRSEELCAALDALHASPCNQASIHGDVRWDNVLAARSLGGIATRRSRLLLLDWESAGAGDPSQDVGAFFGEYLSDWIRSIPIIDVKDPGRLIASAGRPLTRMRPAIGAFWDAYSGGDEGDGLLLRRAVRFAAVRVLAAAYEESLGRNVLSGSAHFALQLSANILRRPDQAIAHLLGISAPWPTR